MDLWICFFKVFQKRPVDWITQLLNGIRKHWSLHEPLNDQFLGEKYKSLTHNIPDIFNNSNAMSHTTLLIPVLASMVSSMPHFLPSVLFNDFIVSQTPTHSSAGRPPIQQHSTPCIFKQCSRHHIYFSIARSVNHMMHSTCLIVKMSVGHLSVTLAQLVYMLGFRVFLIYRKLNYLQMSPPLQQTQ